MDTTTLTTSPDDYLDLERVAVGPYCVFDRFQPSPPHLNDDSLASTSLSDKGKAPAMDDPTMMNPFPFQPNMRSPWVVSAAEDINIVSQSPNDLAQEDWSEWMGWDASQSRSPKPLNIQGPLCFLKQESQRSPTINRRPSGQFPQNPSLALDPSRQMPNNASTPFTFGGSLDNHPAYAFKGVSAAASSSMAASAADVAFPSASWDPLQQFDNLNSLSPPAIDRQQQSSSVPGVVPLSTPSLQHSPSSLTNAHTSPSSTQSSPEPSGSSNQKKRKSSEDDSAEFSHSSKQPPVKKTAHNMIEKRYRTNLNDKIAALRDSVPSLRVISRSNGSGDNEDDPEDLEGLTPAHKLNKATVLSKATEYIHHLEKRVKRLQEELSECKNRLETYNKLAISGSMRIPNGVTTPDGMPYQADPFSSVPVQGPPVTQAPPPQGLIPVPESLANLHRAAQTQQHYAYSQTAPPQPGYPVHNAGPPRHHVPPQQQQQMMNGRRVPSNSMMGKLMVGSLAGLMVLEGWSEREKSGKEPNGRGLFALPTSLFSQSSYAFHGAYHHVSIQQTLLAFARSMMLLFAMVYLLSPLLHFPRSPKKKASTANIRLTQAPSLASPVEVRRTAWLTAIQTVWVPRHNFFLEAAAIGLKTLKLSTRKLIGWHGYALLTGITRDQEAARVKAWEIALDAQLTGGDAEISNSRLLLTLMASGTLPDNPARLMLKALHVRILLWGYAQAGYGSWFMFEELSAKIARHYWNKAREEHKVNMNCKETPQEDRLPPHLAALVELDCDQVLVHSIIQRAYNVAWNKPNPATVSPDESLDTVVEDFAISSPLDALSAWWSGTILSQALISYLSTGKQEVSDAVSNRLDHAYDTAPPLSGSQVRAMVARALLLEDERKESIASAVKALPTEKHTKRNTPTKQPEHPPFMNVENNIPAANDMKKSLTLAKCLHLVQDSKKTNSQEAKLRATNMVNCTNIPAYDLTLLSFVASYKVLLEFSQDDSLVTATRPGLERIANNVRVWIGRDTGKKSGISNKTRGAIVEKCLQVNKLLVGMPEEVDAGYVSGGSDVKNAPEQ